MEDLLAVAAVVVILWLIFRSRSKSEEPNGAGLSNASSTATSTHHWPGSGSFDFEVVGESNYQPALARLAGQHGDDAPDAVCVAHLVLDDRNPHDDKAVRVQVNGSVVGYLARADARSFRRRLSAKRLQGTTSCDALITGGYKMRDGSRASYGIALDMKPFE